jgi:hypothetical protein
MPEIRIKYKKARTLKALKDFAKYFDYVISPSPNEKSVQVNGVTIIKGDVSINDSALSRVFTRKKIDARALRTSLWTR